MIIMTRLPRPCPATLNDRSHTAVVLAAGSRGTIILYDVSPWVTIWTERDGPIFATTRDAFARATGISRQQLPGNDSVRVYPNLTIHTRGDLIATNAATDVRLGEGARVGALPVGDVQPQHFKLRTSCLPSYIFWLLYGDGEQMSYHADWCRRHDIVSVGLLPEELETLRECAAHSSSTQPRGRPEIEDEEDVDYSG